MKEGVEEAVAVTVGERPRVLFVAARLGEDPAGRLAERAAASAPDRYEVEVATTAQRYGPDGVAVLRFASASPPPARMAGPLGEELALAAARGPWSAQLLEHLHRHHHRYRAIVFFGYAASTTAFGLPLAAERATLVPLAGDEPVLRAVAYRALFHLPRAIGFASAEERALVHAVFRNEQVPDRVLDPADGAAVCELALAAVGPG